MDNLLFASSSEEDRGFPAATLATLFTMLLVKFPIISVIDGIDV